MHVPLKGSDIFQARVAIDMAKADESAELKPQLDEAIKRALSDESLKLPTGGELISLVNFVESRYAGSKTPRAEAERQLALIAERGGISTGELVQQVNSGLKEAVAKAQLGKPSDLASAAEFHHPTAREKAALLLPAMQAIDAVKKNKDELKNPQIQELIVRGAQLIERDWAAIHEGLAEKPSTQQLFAAYKDPILKLAQILRHSKAEGALKADAPRFVLEAPQVKRDFEALVGGFCSNGVLPMGERQRRGISCMRSVDPAVLLQEGDKISLNLVKGSVLRGLSQSADWGALSGLFGQICGAQQGGVLPIAWETNSDPAIVMDASKVRKLAPELSLAQCSAILEQRATQSALYLISGDCMSTENAQRKAVRGEYGEVRFNGAVAPNHVHTILVPESMLESTQASVAVAAQTIAEHNAEVLKMGSMMRKAGQALEKSAPFRMAEECRVALKSSNYPFEVSYPVFREKDGEFKWRTAKATISSAEDAKELLAKLLVVEVPARIFQQGIPSWGVEKIALKDLEQASQLAARLSNQGWTLDKLPAIDPEVRIIGVPQKQITLDQYGVTGLPLSVPDYQGALLALAKQGHFAGGKDVFMHVQRARR